MSTSRQYIDFILEQLSSLDGITYRQMMGEYIIYRFDKIAAYVCDNRLMVKPVPSAVRLMPDAAFDPPYEGASDMLVVENVDDSNFLRELFDAIQDELPSPKKRKKKV